MGGGGGGSGERGGWWWWELVVVSGGVVKVEVTEGLPPGISLAWDLAWAHDCMLKSSSHPGAVPGCAGMHASRLASPLHDCVVLIQQLLRHAVVDKLEEAPSS